MGTTAEKLSYLNTTKTKIKEALNLGGANITNETFRQYVDKIKDRYLYYMLNGTQVVWNNWNKVSGTGTSLTLNNTEEAPLSLVYKGNTSQTGTPTPSSPVDIQVVKGDNSIVVSNSDNTESTSYPISLSSKNLVYTGWLSNYITRINDSTKAKIDLVDNRICLFFSASAGYNEYDTKYMFKTNWKENTQYTFSFDMKSTSVKGNIAIGYTDNTFETKDIVTANTWSKAVFTSTANKTIKYITAYWIGGSSYIDLSTFMINKGTSALPYTPYTTPIELCKIGTYQDKIDKSSGKNLWNEQWELGNINITTGALEPASNYVRPKDYIKVKPNTTYYRTPSNEGRIFFYQNNKTYIDNVFITSSGGTFTTPSNCDYILFKYYGTTYNNDIAIYEGNTPQEYEPYGIVWYLKKEIGKVVLNGSNDEGWNSYHSVSYGWNYYATAYRSLIPTNFTNLYCLSDYFSYNTTTSDNNIGQFTIGGAITSKNGNIVFNPYGDTENKIADFKTWLASHNVSVYFPLATPTYETITDTTLISQLEAIKKSYENVTNISQVNNDLPFELSVTALEEMN